MYTVLPQSEGAVLGLEISGRIDIEQERALIAKAEAVIKEHDKIKLLVVVREGTSATFEATMADFKWISTHVKNLGKLAIVADSKVLGWLVAQDAKIAKHLGIGERHFTTDDMDAAWAWIRED
ncbi:STAS/SEC14 domain-containing protein [Hoeflea sp. TYP-13]|uniref:STAS/SEC14 domain-containing protein n=1 Tax=Hoeflea sp. TYP-13 TaxID=3230023 RepID=UPI0034C64D7C